MAINHQSSSGAWGVKTCELQHKSISTPLYGRKSRGRGGTRTHTTAHERQLQNSARANDAKGRLGISTVSSRVNALFVVGKCGFWLLWRSKNRACRLLGVPCPLAVTLRTAKTWVRLNEGGLSTHVQARRAVALKNVQGPCFLGEGTRAPQRPRSCCLADTGVLLPRYLWNNRHRQTLPLTLSFYCCTTTTVVVPLYYYYCCSLYRVKKLRCGLYHL